VVLEVLGTVAFQNAAHIGFARWDMQAKRRSREWWDRFFLGMAQYVASASKDPSTKTGAVVVDGNDRVVSCGYNGFPCGIEDDPSDLANREMKYKKIIHSEVNAILFAKQDLTHHTLYVWPFQPCSRCATLVIQSGIIRVVAPVLPPELKERWGDDVSLAKGMFEEASVQLKLY
jgi:dCMP deaminase